MYEKSTTDWRTGGVEVGRGRGGGGARRGGGRRSRGQKRSGKERWGRQGEVGGGVGKVGGE